VWHRSSVLVQIAAGRVVLRQYRFELGVVALAALLLAAYIVSVEVRLAAIGAPRECFADWLSTGPDGRDDCANTMPAWVALFRAESPRIFQATMLLPFVAGLVLGAPLIARELEFRTAQTAWSLNPSRLGWLMRQALPILVVLGASVALVSAAASPLAQHAVDLGDRGYELIGSHGASVVIRAFASFGVALFLGALLGRTLPGLILATSAVVLLSVGIGDVREAWVRAQPPTVVGESTTAITVGWAWRTPVGSIITDAEAKAIVPPEVAQLDIGLAQAVNSLEWLDQRGYTLLPLEVTDEVATGWTAYDVGLFGIIGVLSAAGSIVVVNTRRPR